MIKSDNLHSLLNEVIKEVSPNSNELTPFFFIKLHPTFTSRGWQFNTVKPSLFEKVGSILNDDRENTIRVTDSDIFRKVVKEYKYKSRKVETRFETLISFTD
jgi:hypothetical protein